MENSLVIFNAPQLTIQKKKRKGKKKKKTTITITTKQQTP